MSALALTAVNGSADEVQAYRDAVRQAHAMVTAGVRQHDPKAGPAAADVLATGVGDSQPEIMADLRGQPPNLQDADVRLAALETALGAPADTANASEAHRALQRILAMPRYQAMRAQPSPLDRIINWLLQRLINFLSALGVGGGGRAIIAVLLVAFLVAAAVIAGLVLRDAQRRRVQRRAAAGVAVRKLAADRFAEADRLAAAGDYAGALRALATGVSTSLGGEEAWDVSPLTVRELFRRADHPEALRPLLHPFEAAVYGHRSPDLHTYSVAAEAAAPYRERRP